MGETATDLAPGVYLTDGKRLVQVLGKDEQGRVLVQDARTLREYPLSMEVAAREWRGVHRGA